MIVDVLDHVAGARLARGTVVVIDVFRAFATAAYAYDGGAARVLPVAEVATALELRERLPDTVLVGERHARRLAGFDAGNSPTDLRVLNLRGRTVVHTTHAGTQGLLAADAADEVVTGSFVNISAVCRYIRARAPVRVSLVRMGHEARERCLEDDLYAESLERMLEGRDARLDAVRDTLKHAEAAKKFFDPACDWAPQTDFDYCTDVDRFSFVLRLRREPGEPPCLERIDMPSAAGA